jgi:hypothetical protein
MNPEDLLGLPLSAYTPGRGDQSMEGGWQTSSGAPVYPFEWYVNGNAPHVTGATSNKDLIGQTVYRTIGDQVVPVKLTDYGPGVKGIDIASTNAEWAKSFPYQGHTDTPETIAAAYANAPTLGQSPLLAGSSLQQGSAPVLNLGNLPVSNLSASPPGQSQWGQGGSVIGSALSRIGQGISQQGQSGMSQALAMLQQRSRGPLESYLQSLLNPGG